MLNIRELARLAGVSPGAASLALRGRPGVSEETRKRVASLAAKHGYRPNPMVTALMTQVGARQRRRVDSIIGLLTTLNVTRYPMHSTPRLFLNGINQAAGRAGYVVEPFTHGHFDEQVPLARMLNTRRIRGVILHEMQDEFVALTLDRSQFAFVAVGVPIVGLPVDFVCNDHRHSVSLALQNLRRLGYRRPGLALDGKRPEHAESGMLAAMLLAQFRDDAGDCITPLVTAEWSPQVLLEWYHHEKPDVILSSDHLALDWLRDGGVRVPREVGFAHMDVDPSWKGIAGVDQCNEEVGAATMDLLISLLNGNRFGLPKHPRTVKLQGSWVAGATAPPK